MTKSPETLDRSVIRSSVMPSAKYACAASPLMLSNGRTAIEGFPGADSAAVAVPGLVAATGGAVPDRSHTAAATTIGSATPAAETRPTGRSSQRIGFAAARVGDCGAPSSLTEHARI